MDSSFFGKPSDKPVKLKHNSTFASIANVLSVVTSKMGLEKRLREQTVKAMWPGLVNEILSQRSRPLFIDAQGNLVVGVADSATAQELSMMRLQLLPKLSSLGQTVGISIRGLRFDLKHFAVKAEPVDASQLNEPDLPLPSQQEIASTVLDKDEQAQVDSLASELAGSSPHLSEFGPRILKLYERQLKFSKWCRVHGYPPR